MIGQFKIFIADMKNLDECKAAELLGKCDASMHRAVLTEFEVAVADRFVKYAADTKKRHKAIDGAHNRCVQKGGDPSCSISVLGMSLTLHLRSGRNQRTRRNSTWKVQA